MRANPAEPIATDTESILRLPWCRTHQNYFDASKRALDPTIAASDSFRYTSIAIASLNAFFTGIEAHPVIQSNYKQDDGAFDWLDKASDHWRAQRQARSK